MSEKEVAPTGLPRSSTLASTSSAASTAAIPQPAGDVGFLLVERLQAWKHAVGYLEAYVLRTEEVHKVMQKEYGKVLKTVEEPLREGHQFEQSVGGIAAFFEALRADTVAISNSHGETATALKSQVLPVLERLHKEIKDRTKHVQNECDKGAKIVAKSRNSTQAHLELLGQHASAFDSAGGASPSSHTGGLHLHTTSTTKPKPDFDPFLLKKGVMFRLNKQVQEENAQMNDLIGVQGHFKQFEEHVIQTVQQALMAFDQTITIQNERQKQLYGDILSNAVALPADFEWRSFNERFGHVLVAPDAPKRNMESISFPNEDHPGTAPLLEGSLQRKGKIMRSYYSSYYAVTPSKYLHEFKEPDNKTYAKEYEPEMSLYLPECTIGALKDGKFQISGKDAGSKMSTKHDFAFKAGSPAEAAKWHEAISRCAGLKTGESPLASPLTGGMQSPPAYSRHNSEQTVGSAEIDNTAASMQVGRAPPAAAVTSPVTSPVVEQWGEGAVTK